MSKKSPAKPSRAVNPRATLDFRLVVGAALSPVRKPDGTLDRDRIIEHVAHLVAENVDSVAVSTAHGHTAGVGEVVKLVSRAFPDLTMIAGNVTSGAGVAFLGRVRRSRDQDRSGTWLDLHDADCSRRWDTATHRVARVGSDCGEASGVKLIADGGITKSGDIVKALTLSDAVILGGLLAGCREAPGEIMEISGKVYKQYRGMGSLAAMKAGSAARYGHDKNDKARKVAAEGIEALKEVSGSVDDVLATLVGGVQSGMGYLGAANLTELRAKARFIRVSPAGVKEAAPHDVIEVSTRTSNA